MNPLRFSLHLLLALLLALGAAACDRGSEAPAPDETADGEPDEEAEHEDERDAAVPASAGVVLSRDGLGVARFGDEAEAALAKLRDAMGTPNTLSKWLPMERSLWGTCPGSEVRGAKWGDLWVLFSDRSELSEQRHLSGWLLGGSSALGRTELKTSEGIGLSSTLAELRAAYGDRLTLEPSGLGQRFFVEPAEGEKAGSRLLAGTVSGDEDDDTVGSLRGGLACTT